MKAKVGKIILLCLATLGAVFAWQSDFLFFEAPQRLEDSAFRRVARRLAKKHDIHFLMTFDEPRLREWISQRETRSYGTESVRGRLGRARRFKNSQYANITTSVPWPELGDSFTMSVWVKLKKNPPSQTIWFSNFGNLQIGFRLQNGIMGFYIPEEHGHSSRLSYPFNAYGKYVRLTAVVNLPLQEARLYENGVLKDTIGIGALSLPAHNIEFGKFRWYATTEPLNGDIDEAVIWRRVLPPREIKTLASSRMCIAMRNAPFSYLAWKLMRANRDIPRTTLKMLDRGNPFMLQSQSRNRELPQLPIYLSSNDLRFFIYQHDRSLASGRRIKPASRPRRILMHCGGEVSEAELQLDGADSGYLSTKRQSYILDLGPTNRFEGLRIVRLVPPESLGDDLGKLIASPNREKKSVSSGFCRLWINGLPKGIYLYEPYERCAVITKNREGIVDHDIESGRWSVLFRPQRDHTKADPYQLSRCAAAELFKPVLQMISGDVFCPWSRRELKWRVRSFLGMLTEEAYPLPSEFNLLADNPAPDYIVSNLSMANGPHEISWTSSHPEIIDVDGQVRRPLGKSPAAVTLTATDSGRQSRELRFRVMPATPRTSALMIYCREPPVYKRRVEFRADLYRADLPPVPLKGSQWTGGGLKHRGNTSYWRGKKKSFSLRFDEPMNIVGSRTSRYLYLLNGYSDPTKLRNKLVYDLFRSWPDDGSKRFAPEMDWIEVFVNGQYHGIFEACTRIDGNMLGFSEEPLDPSAVLYKIRPDPQLFTLPSTTGFNQKFPRPKQDTRLQPLQDLMAFVSGSSQSDFAANIEKWIDVDNAIDFLLMLNFSGNMDGRYTNFYLAREGGQNKPFFFIPWDYDHTFGDKNYWLSNHLLDRLCEELPDFQKRSQRRWRRLRTGVMHEEALERRIMDMTAEIEDLMRWESQALGINLLPYPDIVAELQQAVKRNLQYMDAKMTDWDAP